MIAWFGIVGSLVYDEVRPSDSRGVQAAAVFKEGDSYMLLTRENDEIGFIHEARTFVNETESWLLEYDLFMNVAMMGIDQYLQTKIKATVSRDAILQDFNASVVTGGATFELTGTVEGNAIEMSIDLAGQERTSRIQLNEPPRLANSALNELVANPDLTPGMRFEQEYFDPTKMGMTTMTFEFIRQHDVYVYEQRIPAYQFRQHVGGTELDAYVDKHGDVQLQEFPLRIVGTRAPPELGAARAKALEERMKKDRKNKQELASPKVADLSLESAMGLLRGESGLEKAGLWRLSGIPEGIMLALDSGEQKVILKNADRAEVDTEARAEMPEVTPEEIPEELKAADARVDADHEIFAGLLADPPPESLMERAEQITRAVHGRMKPVPEIGVQMASMALEGGTGDCTEYALVLVAALRHHGLAARFVSGLRLNAEGLPIAHQWVQYYDGKHWVDLDPTNDTLIPNSDQIQLFTHAEPEDARLTTLLDRLKVERAAAQPPAPEEKPKPSSDFN